MINNTTIDYTINKNRLHKYPDFLNGKSIKDVIRFHQSMDEYKITPLVELKALASSLNIENIFVKDESFRFGLNAFKSLGATFAIANILCKILNININQVSFKFFEEAEIKKKIENLVFVTATDGNHGRGLAWAAHKLGCKSVVYMPKDSSEIRLKAIENEGAEAYITDLNYDDAVRYAEVQAIKNNWILVQDTAWKGYTEIPNWIVQGYATMAMESHEQLLEKGYKKPTHIILQAGVGSMAGSILGYYSNIYKEETPYTIIIEPENANCIYKSAVINDGDAHVVSGSLNTIMAGLACGEPNPITWEVINNLAYACVSCSDSVSAHGSRILANPIESDSSIISGESGSVSIGLLDLILRDDKIKSDLKLNKDSVVLCFSTEGDTDPEHYKRILSEGLYPL